MFFSGLLFRIGRRVLNSGDFICITDIGVQPLDRDDPGHTLVCDTSNVNQNCCRNAESGIGAIGNWYLPTGLPIISLNKLQNNGSINDTLYRVLHTHQVRLGSTGSPTGPLGFYICSVPNINGVYINASIKITCKFAYYFI